MFLTRSLPTAMLVLALASTGTSAAEREAPPSAVTFSGAWTTRGLTSRLLLGRSSGPTGNPTAAPHPSLIDLGLPAGNVTAACAQCHDIARDVTHPVGVVPSMPVPADFPLDAAGRTTCLTCHDMPATAEAAAVTGEQFLLRHGRVGRAFCSECHTKFLGTGSNQHALMAQAAHGGGRSSAAGPMSGDIDEESLDCMGCHDGTIGAETTSEVRSLSVSTAAGPGLGRSHPVGVAYQDAALHGATLSPSGPRNASVRLIAGKVGCGSCHSVYSKHRNLLVMDNARDALCMQCHAK